MDRSVHPTTTISKDVGFLSKVRWIAVSIKPQQYQRMLDSYPRSDGSKCPSNHNNIRGCWILYPRSDGSSVHPTTTILKDVGSYIQGPMDQVSILSPNIIGGGSSVHRTLD